MRTEQRQNEDAAEADVQAGERKHDKAARRQPVGEALEAGEAQDLRPRKAVINANSSAHQQENQQQSEHPDDGNAANDRQRAALKIAPFAAGGLNQAGRHGIGDRYPPGDLVALFQSIQKLVLVDGFGCGLEGKLCRSRMGEDEQQRHGSA